MIGLEALDLRFPWRSFVQDWLVAAFVIIVYLLAAALVSGADLDTFQFQFLIPQVLLSLVTFPIIAGMVSLLDRLRLKRVRKIG